MQDLHELETIRSQLITIGETVSDSVAAEIKAGGTERASSIHAHCADDVIYRIDRIAEEILLERLAWMASGIGGIRLIAEGLGQADGTDLPRPLNREQPRWWLLIDPIDGTRGLMVDKRPAFFLAGIAPNTGSLPSLSDICVAVMVEIPTTRMSQCDTFSAIRNHGATGSRRNLITGEESQHLPQPSSSDSIRGGFAQFSRFFSPGKEFLARMEEELLASLFPDAASGEIVAFEDQYISSGGQLYELLTGKDRFVADVRAAMYRSLDGTMRTGHVCHPYDLAAHLIGKEAGLVITGINGDPLNGPFSTTHPMDWIGYANHAIYNEVSPTLNFLIKKYKLL